MDLITDGCALIWSKIAFTIIHVHFLLPTIINGGLLILCILFTALSVYAGKNIGASHTFHPSKCEQVHENQVYMSDLLQNDWFSFFYIPQPFHAKKVYYTMIQMQLYCMTSQVIAALKCSDWNVVINFSGHKTNKERRETGALTSWLRLESWCQTSPHPN